MPTVVCPRCRRANPDGARYCYFDGVTLQVGVAGAPPPLAREFTFPSGRRCRSFEELAQACLDEWAAARQLLVQGALGRYLESLGRHDLAQAAHEAIAQGDPDIALTRFVNALPVMRPPATKIDIHPRRAALGQLLAGEQRNLQLVIANQGQGTLQGTVRVGDGATWLRLPGGERHCSVHAPREQRLDVVVDTKGLAAAQGYDGKLTVVTNGGIVEVPIGFVVVPQPYPSGPFQGVRTQRELAERMKAQPKAAVPILESGEVMRWFAANGWKYPVVGTPAKGVAGVQQFFEAMGLSKPPQVQLSQTQVRFTVPYPQTLKFQVTLQTTSRKWVYGQASSDAPWLKVLTPQVAGPQKAALSLEIDTRALPGPQAQGVVSVTANAGQKLELRVQVEATGMRSWSGGAAPAWLRSVVAVSLAFFWLRLALVPVVDCGGRAAVVRATAQALGHPPEPGSPLARNAGWLALPWTAILSGRDEAIPLALFQSEATPGTIAAREFRHHYAAALVRSLVLWTWWVGAVGGLIACWRRGGPAEAGWGLVAGAIAGVVASATVACLFLVLEIVPHALARAVLGNAAGPAAWLVWVVMALIGWTAIGLAVGLLFALLPPLRAGILLPVQHGVAGICRLFRLNGLARLCAPAN
ncbi:MAG: zinc ribbon domain-containing protein [Gemmataceae bacterium]|nr:zinc ribbon domain-containing protein [Gemmataceae bacterium]